MSDAACNAYVCHYFSLNLTAFSFLKYYSICTFRYQLMDNAVQPTTLDPLYYRPLEILTHIAVDVVPTKPHGSLKVLYVATAEGTVKKITILPKSSVTCTLEEWIILSESSDSQIMALHYLKVTVCNKSLTFNYRSTCSNGLNTWDIFL